MRKVQGILYHKLNRVQVQAKTFTDPHHNIDCIFANGNQIHLNLFECSQGIEATLSSCEAGIIKGQTGFELENPRDEPLIRPVGPKNSNIGDLHTVILAVQVGIIVRDSLGGLKEPARGAVSCGEMVGRAGKL